MKTIVKKITGYNFDELTDRAKDHARYNYFSDYHWANDALNSLSAFADEVGISINDYSIDWYSPSQSYIKWSGNPKTKYIKEELTGYCMDYALTKEYNKNHDVDAAIDNWLHECSKDYEYQLSDEYLTEHCSINENLFDEEGNLI